MFAVCRSDQQLETERSSSADSSVRDVTDERNKSCLQIVSVDDAEFEKLLCEAVANGEE